MIIKILFLAVSTSTVIFGNEPPPLTAVVDTLIFENFNGPQGPFQVNPLPGWTVSDSGFPVWDETSWSLYELPVSYEPYWNGDLAHVFFAGPGAIADWLISPVIDCANETAVAFSFKQRHSNSLFYDTDTAFVFGSTNGGLTWDHTVFMTVTSMGEYTHPDTQMIDISSWAAGQGNVRIAFVFKGSYILTWHIDEPMIGGDFTDTLLFEGFDGSWGPYGDNPPADWTIINEVQPAPADSNDWSRWLYSAWQDTVARVNHAPAECQIEWLITPAFAVDNIPLCSLSFYTYFRDDSSTGTDTCYVLGSKDDGLTWPMVMAAYADTDEGCSIREASYRSYDMTWAAGEEHVKIGFKYVGTDAWWWVVDDVAIFKTILYDDNVEASSFDYPLDFLVTGESYNPLMTASNLGAQQQTFDVNLKVKNPDDMEVYDQIETGITLESLESTQITFATDFVPALEGDYTFTAVVINPGDEAMSDDTIMAEVMSFAHRDSAGPDGYGYYYIDNTREGSRMFNWIDISETGTQIEPNSHYFMSAPIPIGFSFEFYGGVYDTMWVNSNGAVHIGKRDLWLVTNDCPVPDTSAPHAPMAMVFWDLLKIRYEIGQGVYFQSFDTAEVDFMVIQWSASIDDEPDDSLEFEAILHEDGTLLYQYNQIPPNTQAGQGQFATIGIEYDSIPSGLSYLCNDDNPANRLESGLAIKWFMPFAGYAYLPGDVNMYVGIWPPVIIASDVTYLVNYFKGYPSSRRCLLDDFWCSADANGDCNIIGSDVTKMVNYFRGNGRILYCPSYEPAWHSPDELPLEAPPGWPNCE